MASLKQQMPEGERSPEPPRPRRRGLASQRPRRERECRARRRAVTCTQWMCAGGATHGEAARALGLSPSTLASWERAARRGTLGPRARGRPPRHASRAERTEILSALREEPSVGVFNLMGDFPEVSRHEIGELKQRYVYAHRRRGSELVCWLRWTRVGAMWAADFTQPPWPIDGLYPLVFAVRDLASGKELLARPVWSDDASTIVELLQALFERHGAPLALKIDNGPGLRAWATKLLLEAWGVLALYSPPGLPSYNGSREAGIGSLKLRASESAARRGCAWRWSSDDLEAARLRMDEEGSPSCNPAAIPRELWERRAPIQPAERKALLARYRYHEARERRAEGIANELVMAHYEQAAVDRVAIRRALVDEGLLVIRRKRISPRIVRRRTSRIS